MWRYTLELVNRGNFAFELFLLEAFVYRADRPVHGLIARLVSLCRVPIGTLVVLHELPKVRLKLTVHPDRLTRLGSRRPLLLGFGDGMQRLLLD